MHGFYVTVRAGQLAVVICAHGNEMPSDLVVFGLMAVNTLEIITSHVNVNVLCREEKAAVQIAVFHGIAATAVKMTTTTVLTGRCADTLGHVYQVDIFRRMSFDRKQNVTKSCDFRLKKKCPYAE
jgi:hypothetical protein